MSETKPVKLEVVKVPKLKSGDDAAYAKQFAKLFSDAQTGMRRIVALGLFAWEIKELHLKHGEFGPWLAGWQPKLCRADSKTGKPKASHALENAMRITQGVLESVGYKTIGDYLDHLSKFPIGGICHHGKFMMLPEKKVTPEIKPLREKICALIDGKTQQQLFWEFKQAEEDEDGEVKKKHGRLKGSKGLTKEQREAAKLREEKERIEDLEEAAADNGKWLEEFCDDQNGGMIDEAKFAKFAERIEYAHAYCQRVLKMRKG